MADTVNIGSAPNDNLGNPLRQAFNLINIKFEAIQAGYNAEANDIIDRVETAHDGAVAAEIAAETAQTASEVARSAAQVAQALAQAARDSAFVNANVYADVATGLAAVVDGVQFQVVNSDGLSIQRYRRDAGPVATPVGAPFSTAAPVVELRRSASGALIQTANIFDKNDSGYTVGSLVNHSTGLLNAFAGYDATGFIDVKPSTSYYISNKNRIAWYSAAKVYISGDDTTDGTPGKVVTSPSGAAYLRATLHAAAGTSKDAFYVVEGSSPLVVYEPYGGYVAVDRIRNLPATSIANSAVTPLKTSFLSATRNLFNSAAITPSQFLSAAGVLTASGTYDVSDFIPVTPGLPYVANAAIRFHTAYDSSGTVMSGAGSNTQVNAGSTITPAAGVAFLRITVFKVDTASFQLEQGSTATGFIPYGFALSPQIQVPPGTIASEWQDVRAASFGDSITAQAQWQPGVVTALGLNHTAYGVGGRQVGGASGMCQDAAVNTIPTDRELVLVLGGTNDWAQSRVLGTPSSSNTEEFYGALNQMCSKLVTRLPNAVICLLTTTYGELPARITEVSWPNAHTNLAGLTTRDYAEAVRVAGKRWGFPVIDTSETGVNTVNVQTYTINDGGWIHPNAAGGARMARVITGALRTLAPL